MLQTLRKLSDEFIVNKLKCLKSSENHTLAEIILYLSELDTRKHYRELGYSSLFSYCTEALGYSESAAYRRIQAARMLRTNPEIYEKVKLGKLSLSAIAEVSKVKESAPKEELLKQAEGKTKKEIELLTVKHMPFSKPKRETIMVKRLINPEPDLFLSLKAPEIKEAFTITIEVDKGFMELLNEVKELLGHQPTSEIFRRTLKEYSTKRRALKRLKASKQKTSRFVAKSVKVAVRERDKNQCTFVASDGKRCCEKHALEFDHIIPYAAGGSSDYSNLRLLCKSHNLLMAERVFGQEKIQAFSR